MNRLLLLLVMVGLLGAACSGSSSGANSEVNGANDLVCDTEYLFAEVQWLVDHAWGIDAPATVVSVSAMPLPSGLQRGGGLTAGPATEPRLIGARITTTEGYDNTFLWLVVGKENIAEMEWETAIVPAVNIGTQTDLVFRRLVVDHNWLVQKTLDAALPMAGCLGGPPGQ